MGWYPEPMDENRPIYRLQAPGAGAVTSYELPSPDRAPRRRRRPRLDEHRVTPENEPREELIDGRVLRTSPADFAHASLNSDLDYLLRAHVAPGYRVANDLLTRHDLDNDFASDSAVLRDGIDPRTGARYLEEIAFEVVSSQHESVASRKASTMLKRGVQRVFAVFVKDGRVAEWVTQKGREDGGCWEELGAGATISHPSLAQPIPVAAILDATLADDTVVRALDAKDNPAIAEIRARERVEGLAQAILTVLSSRGLEPGSEIRERILSCIDATVLNRWLRAASTAASVDEIVD